MKLRVQNDSLRLRLTVSEVRRIGEGRSVIAETRFPGAVLAYRLVPSFVDTMSAALEASTVTVRVPRAQARAWARGAAVSLCGDVSLEPERRLSLLVEKDLTCLNPRPDEDPADRFVNPEVASALA